MDPPASLEDWRRTLRRRFDRKNRELRISSPRAAEVFTITAWGEIPEFDTLERDFPGLLLEGSHIPRLKDRLCRWRGEA